jgi:hypothetical protein
LFAAARLAQILEARQAAEADGAAGMRSSAELSALS